MVQIDLDMLTMLCRLATKAEIYMKKGGGLVTLVHYAMLNNCHVAHSLSTCSTATNFNASPLTKPPFCNFALWILTPTVLEKLHHSGYSFFSSYCV